MFTSPAGGPGFAFDLPGIESAIAEWTDLAESLAMENYHFTSLRGVTGPGDEFSSADLAAKATDALGSFRRHLAAMTDFTRGYVAALTASRDEYVARDDDARATFGRQDVP
ncbi:hypothetical protein [Actinosynnema sp. NPDC023587]|uniref:hypothetical protein n=1 Tax=Actinosynnema sp. NPDC023587 TaxID=3154695 RepID=UPI00340B92FD